MAIGSDPGRVGATISSTDATTLAALDATGLPLGTVVYVSTLAIGFVLTLSAAALVTNQVVAVSGVAGYRWIVEQGGSGSIPLAELAPQAAHTFVGNATAGSASPAAMTAAAAAAMLPLLPAALFKSFCSLGADASGGATHITATGVKIGDKVVMVADVTDHVSAVGDFEATVTVADQIQQASVDLSAKTLVILVIAQS